MDELKVTLSGRFYFYFQTLKLRNVKLDNLFYLVFYYPNILKSSLSSLQSRPPRYSTTDHWIQEVITRIFNSRLFWAVGTAEKKNTNCHKVPSINYVLSVGGGGTHKAWINDLWYYISARPQSVIFEYITCGQCLVFRKSLPQTHNLST